MKRIFWTALVAALTTALVASMALAQPGNSKGKALGHNKEPVCHNGKTLYLPAPAVIAHERHGDTPAACGDTTPPPSAQCADSEDNDGDSLIDFPADPGCTDAEDDDETDTVTPPNPLAGATTVRSTGPNGLVLAGTLSKDGSTLKTASGDTLKLKAKSAKGEKRLEALAKKKTKVKVTGKMSGDTLEVSQLKTTKGKRK